MESVVLYLPEFLIFVICVLSYSLFFLLVILVIDLPVLSFQRIMFLVDFLYCFFSNFYYFFIMIVLGFSIFFL